MSTKTVPEWRQALDKSTGKFYYYNKRTKETTWNPPPTFKVI